VVWVCQFNARSSEDFTTNLNRLQETSVSIQFITEQTQPDFATSDLIIDALLGSGFRLPLSQKYEQVVRAINKAEVEVVSVDVPSGFLGEGEMMDYQGVKSNWTLSFQQAKLNFFFPESIAALQEFSVIDIGLSSAFISAQDTPWHLITPEWVGKQLKPRQRFSHKMSFGHALIVAGDVHTMGAALLSAQACLSSGVGMLTVSLPETGLSSLNIRIPEAMYLSRTALAADTLDKYQAIAIGPGLGLGANAKQTLIAVLAHYAKPMVLDADALNLLALQPELMDRLPKYSVLTPHCKEFDRLFGTHNSWWHRLQTAQKMAVEKQIIIVLKNQYTFVCSPNGKVAINTSGNPAMAQAGMGDVLSGLIASFLAQGYLPEMASCLAVFIHGYAADDLAEANVVVRASQLGDYLSVAIKKLV
jgi:hydroxyethylthiazole kinase-like uncharacterized protein yjeF